MNNQEVIELLNHSMLKEHSENAVYKKLSGYLTAYPGMDKLISNFAEMELKHAHILSLGIIQLGGTPSKVEPPAPDSAQAQPDKEKLIGIIRQQLINEEEAVANYRRYAAMITVGGLKEQINQIIAEESLHAAVLLKLLNQVRG